MKRKEKRSLQYTIVVRFSFGNASDHHVQGHDQGTLSSVARGMLMLSLLTLVGALIIGNAEAFPILCVSDFCE